MARSIFTVRAVSDDEWGLEELSAVPEALPKDPAEINGGVESFYGTDRGVRMTNETMAEITELVKQIGAKNPTPAPTEPLPLFSTAHVACMPVCMKKKNCAGFTVSP